MSGRTLAQRLVGAWRLVAYEAEDAGGTIRHPLGPDARGLLVYTRSGHMSVQLMRPGRPAWIRDATPSAEGYLAYAGRWQVDEAGATVTHHVELSLLPDWIGAAQVREVAFDGDVLTLTAAPSRIGGVVATARLTWARAPAGA